MYANHLVSVIIPYFNCHQYIKQTLDSVIGQTHSAIEIIIVNDGSDQKSTGFLKQLLKDYPDVIYIEQNNHGVSSARNVGALKSKGDFLIFLDADDRLSPFYIEKTLCYLINNPTCKAVYSRIDLFDRQSGEWLLPDFIDFKDLLIANKIIICALHKKEDFLRINGFDTNLQFYEDWDYWIRLINGGCAKRIDEVLFFYRKRQDNSSLTDKIINSTKENKRHWQRVCQKNIDIYIDNNLSYLDFFEQIQVLKDQNKNLSVTNKKITDELIDSQKKSDELIKNTHSIQSSNQIEQNLLKNQISHLNDTNNSLILHNNQLQQHNNQLEQQIKRFKKLWVIKLLKPFIKLELGLHSLNRYRKQFRKLCQINGSIQTAHQQVYQIYKKQGLLQAKKFLKDYQPNLIEKNSQNINATPDKPLNIDENIIILCTKHTHYIAKLLKNSLSKINSHAEIIFEEPKIGYRDEWHIVICPQIFNTLPQHYIAFQMEQSVSSRWFTSDYFLKLNNAKFIFDYSLQNIKFLQDNGIEFSKIFYLPIGLLSQEQNTEKNLIATHNHEDNRFKKTYDHNKHYWIENNAQNQHYEYDVTFYGDPNCPRRKYFLEKLQERFNIKIISEVFGDDLYDLLKKSKIIVNIHYYENALLETTRLYECLSLNKMIVSERAIDQSEHQELEQFIEFVDINDIDSMINTIDRLLNNATIIQNHLNNLNEQKQYSSKFDFYFYRFLLSQDLLDFDHFYELVHKIIKPKSDFWCLSLPESVDRRNEFIKDNRFDVWIFDGLRHHIGWIGCGLSYKFMLKLAEHLNFAQVSICEDDVLFFEDFEKRYYSIKQDLILNDSDWDIFSGLIADLSRYSTLGKSNIPSSSETYYTIDKVVSMVFNIYNYSIYEKIYSWNPNNKDTSNTIDRYLERHTSIKGIITDRFLVGHKEQLISTLWGFQNTEYSDMINKSQYLLTQKINELNDINQSTKG